MTRNTGRSETGRSAGDDPDVTALLREHYAAPTDESYWAGLESRIMARLERAEQSGEWWNVFAEWRTAGLIAAGLLLSVTGVSLWQEHRLDTQARQLAAGAAYWTVFDGDPEGINIAFTVKTRGGNSERTADRYIYTPEP